MKPDQQINNEFLKKIGFRVLDGTDGRFLTNGILDTYPEYRSSEGQRRWMLTRSSGEIIGLPRELRPKTRAQVQLLIAYMKEVSAYLVEEFRGTEVRE